MSILQFDLQVKSFCKLRPALEIDTSRPIEIAITLYSFRESK